MEKSVQQYKQAVRVIKEAILHSQYRAAKLVTGEQLSLYFGINQDTIDIECFSLQNARQWRANYK